MRQWRLCAIERRRQEDAALPARFLRVHRSAIVRLDRMVEVRPADNRRYRITLTDGTASIVSRSGATALRNLIL